MLYISQTIRPDAAQVQRGRDPETFNTPLEHEMLEWVECSGPTDWLVLPGIGFFFMIESEAGFVVDSAHTLNAYEREFLATQVKGVVCFQIEDVDRDGKPFYSNTTEWYGSLQTVRDRWERILTVFGPMSEVAELNNPQIQTSADARARFLRRTTIACNLYPIGKTDAVLAIVDALTIADTIDAYCAYLVEQDREDDAESIRAVFAQE